MAGDWIKMRVDLGTSPKVVRMSSALHADRLRIVGGLHAVWCLFDVHSVDGKLHGYTADALDDLIGFPGFAASMISVGWLEDGGNFLAAPRFDEHNGQSAKRRAMETERKREARKASASDADKMRSREEKRREEKISPERAGDNVESIGDCKTEGAPPPTSPAGDVCRQLMQVGVAHVSPTHPRLIALLQAGLTVDEIVDAGREAVVKRKGFAWVLATAQGRRIDAANVTPLPERAPGDGHEARQRPRKPSLAERATTARIEAEQFARGESALEPVGADDAHVRAPLDGDFRRVGDE